MYNSTVLTGTVFEEVKRYDHRAAVNSHYDTTAFSTPASYGELSLVNLQTLELERPQISDIQKTDCRDEN
jgi:hypothetical protein